MNTKVAIVSIIGLVSVVGLLVGIYLVQQTQLLDKDASVVSGGKATVTLNPTTASIAVGASQDIAVMLNTGTEQVQGFEFVLNFTYSGESPIDAAVTGMRNINGTTWSYNSSLNTVVIGGGSGRIVIAGSIDSGSMSTNNEAVTVANIRLTGRRATGTTPVSLTFSSSNQDNRVFSGTPAVDILTIPASMGTYTVTGGTQPTATPTQPGNTPAPTATGIPGPTATGVPGPTATNAPAGNTMSITYPLNNSTISTTKPTFRGTGPANSSIMLDFESGLSGTTTASSTGSWSWTPIDPLTGGSHTVTASNDENDDTANVTFTITTSTGSTALPEAGSVETTILIAGLGLALLLIGSWLLI
jgi:hypothetical protein